MNGLGSFPQFGHQARWASERRARAQINSAATHRWKKARALQEEQKLILLLMQLLVGNHPNMKTEADWKWWKRTEGKCLTISKAIQNDRRVYWKRLGKLLRDFHEKIDLSYVDVLQDVEAGAKKYTDGDVAKYFELVAISLSGVDLQVVEDKITQS